MPVPSHGFNGKQVRLAHTVSSRIRHAKSLLRCPRNGDRRKMKAGSTLPVTGERFVRRPSNANRHWEDDAVIRLHKQQDVFSPDTGPGCTHATVIDCMGARANL